MKDILEFDGVELNYGTRKVLSGIYVKCMVGEIVGILGRNGSGKSSLFKVVFGSLTAEHRSVRINGTSSHSLRDRRIAYLPQGGLIPPYISVGKAIRLFGIDLNDVLKYFPEVEGQLSLRPDELSGGYRRIVELMLILRSPSVFCLLDEPFSGVMPVHAETIQKVLKEVSAVKGIILTDHLYRSVMTTADRLYVLANGTAYPVNTKEDLILRGYLQPF